MQAVRESKAGLEIGGEIVAEFQEVMKQWRRMCNDCTTTCSLFDGLCTVMPEMSIQDLSDSDISEIEETVVAWAAEHPKSVYPTWFEWLEGLGVVGLVPDSEPYITGVDKKVYMQVPAFRPKAFDHIPADIAEKLGLQPKEDT